MSEIITLEEFIDLLSSLAQDLKEDNIELTYDVTIGKWSYSRIG